ncbi:MAG: uroporphyrinogen decarboxylase family protein, partial [Atribacterota bacterium]
DLDREMWSTVLDLDMGRIYSNPFLFVEFELRKKIYAFLHFSDDNPLTKKITMWFGVGFLESLLGIPQEQDQPGHEPWVGKISLIKEKEDLKKIPIPDFHSSPSAVRAHRMYAGIKEIVDDDFDIIFPEWDFGPFGIATHLRGIENLSMDFIDDPEFIQELMQFLFSVKKQWSGDRSLFLGEPLRPLYIANDDINVPIISPGVYRDFILPYEKEISLFHGGIDYWHSCGRIDPVLPFIKEIPGLKMIHISPWTDLKKAVEIMGKDHILEVVLNPIDDVEKATPDQMEEKLKSIRERCQGRYFTVRADAFQVFTTVENDLKQITNWIEKAREVFGS